MSLEPKLIVMDTPSATTDPAALAALAKSFPQRFNAALGEVIIGQQAVLELLVTALLCDGHVLLTGVPGLAKTMLVRCLAGLFHLSSNRIQCTPDLMPSDISGIEVLEETDTRERHFRFIPGPVFTNLLLADEINRTSPRTQAALLQAMQERQVTVGGNTHDLSRPFIVFATQNPIDSEGTYPLPEAQLDRFLFNIEIHYPSLEDEVQIAQLDPSAHAPEIPAIFDPETLEALHSAASSVPIAPSLVKAIVALVRQSRPQDSTLPEVQRFVEWGAGVRASQFLVRAARAHALLKGAGAVRLEHVEAVAPAVLRHRIIPNFVAEAEGWTSERLVERLLAHLPTLA
ncbi:MAG: MoxR family ATPase [SAR324 cluster bacterium]|nr:MoxR family ATPase [SAR324 cluster bacterium]